jgi:hypothetical protein
LSSSSLTNNSDIKIGITNVDPSVHNPDALDNASPSSAAYSPMNNVPWLATSAGGTGYLQWENTYSDNLTGSTKEFDEDEYIDVSAYDKIYIVITSVIYFNMSAATYDASIYAFSVIDNIVISNISGQSMLNPLNTSGNSTTWNNYKSNTPAENNNDDYEDDTYWPINGSRYGLDPQHAQVNGSFFIDSILGKVHFSSNISGKTVILDYISDSLGTDGEMQVHKFAEEAMYKHIAYAILSTSSNQLHQQLAPRFKKERFAETRKAKLRLSNIKLEEITQILRGKSKQIKH